MKKYLKPLAKLITLVILLPLSIYLLTKDRVIEKPNGFISGCSATTGLLVEKVNQDPKDLNVSTLQASTTLSNAISSFLSSFSDKQDEYIQTEGEYFQGLDSDKAAKPHYQTKNYSDLGIDTNLPFVVRVDQYLSPDNICGWQARFMVMVGENRYSKSIGRGSNSSQYGHDWQKDEKPY